MTLTLTFDDPPGVFVLTVMEQGQHVTSTSSMDLAFIQQEVRHQLTRMRHLAQGKTFETKQARSDA